MPDEQYERRASDQRIERVEGKVDALTEDLRQHIVDEGSVFTEFKVGIERLAVTAEQHTKVLDRVASTLEGIAQQNARLTVVEADSLRHERHLYDLQKQADTLDDEVQANEEKTNRLYWLGGLVWTAVGALAALVGWLLKG